MATVYFLSYHHKVGACCTRAPASGAGAFSLTGGPDQCTNGLGRLSAMHVYVAATQGAQLLPGCCSLCMRTAPSLLEARLIGCETIDSGGTWSMCHISMVRDAQGRSSCG